MYLAASQVFSSFIQSKHPQLGWVEGPRAITITGPTVWHLAARLIGVWTPGGHDWQLASCELELVSTITQCLHQRNPQSPWGRVDSEQRGMTKNFRVTFLMRENKSLFFFSPNCKVTLTVQLTFCHHVHVSLPCPALDYCNSSRFLSIHTQREVEVYITYSIKESGGVPIKSFTVSSSPQEANDMARGDLDTLSYLSLSCFFFQPFFSNACEDSSPWGNGCLRFHLFRQKRKKKWGGGGRDGED